MAEEKRYEVVVGGFEYREPGAEKPGMETGPLKYNDLSYCAVVAIQDAYLSFLDTVHELGKQKCLETGAPPEIESMLSK